MLRMALILISAPLVGLRGRIGPNLAPLFPLSCILQRAGKLLTRG
jgi:hypothetical protein